MKGKGAPKFDQVINLNINVFDLPSFENFYTFMYQQKLLWTTILTTNSQNSLLFDMQLSKFLLKEN